jgi:hypothetical protein
MKMEAVCFTETMQQTKHTAQCKNPKIDHDLNNNCCEKLIETVFFF